MREKTKLAIYDHLKTLKRPEKKWVKLTLRDNGIMSIPSFYLKLRNSSFSELELRYIHQLLKSIDHAKPD